MPTKAIKKLRIEGNLDQALEMAQELLQSKPTDIWAMRSIAWVYYDYLKQNNQPNRFREFTFYLEAIKKLSLPDDEKMLFDQISWQIGKMAFGLLKGKDVDPSQYYFLFNVVRQFSFTRPSEAYSFLLKPFHKAFKNSPPYIEFVDWWGLENFLPEDYQQETLPNGKEVMALVEQVYITYAKQLLDKGLNRKYLQEGKVDAFLPMLDNLIQQQPQYQYPPYFKSKLLLAKGDKAQVLMALLPFARKKQNAYWVWELMGEAYSDDEEKMLACYCKALSCRSPEEMLVNLRQRVAAILFKKGLYNEAKTEIELLVKTRSSKGFKVPTEVQQWTAQPWYRESQVINHRGFYSKYSAQAEALLFPEIPEVTVLVSAVQSEKELLSFVGADSRIGFFKYHKVLRSPEVGQVLKVRFESEVPGGRHLVYTACPAEDEELRQRYIKDVEGEIKIQPGKNFGFVKDVYVHPSILSSRKLSNGMKVSGKAIKSYQPNKKEWGWKLL